MKVVKLNGKLIASIRGLIGANVQEKTVIPSNQRQEIVADEGYSCLSKVIVEGVSGVPQSVFDSLIDRTITSIESSITNIGNSAFANCSSLTSVSFPNAINIGNYAFQNCTPLKNIYIPNATSIGSSVFYKCTNLPKIELPKVIEIGAGAFNTCLDCQLFDFRGVTQVPTLANNNAFAYTSSTKKIVVPDSLYDSWITATNWSSSENNIVTSIIKASDYEASL